MNNGKQQMKVPTKAEMHGKIAKLEAQNKALQDYIANAIVLIPRDGAAKDFYNDQNGIKIAITTNHAVIISASSIRVFPNSTMIYPWLYTYVDIMLDKEIEHDTDKKEAIIENVQRFLYLLFDTDNNLTNPASMVLDWAYWLAKNSSLLENKGKEVRLNEITFDVIKGMISELIIAKNGTITDKNEANIILNDAKDKIHNFMNDLNIDLETKSCKFNDVIIFEASETTEEEAMAELIFNEQSKKEIVEEDI